MSESGSRSGSPNTQFVETEREYRARVITLDCESVEYASGVRCQTDIETFGLPLTTAQELREAAEANLHHAVQQRKLQQTRIQENIRDRIRNLSSQVWRERS